MASRKNKRPTVARAAKARKAKPTPERNEVTLGEHIIQKMEDIHVVLGHISMALNERNKMLSVVTSETEKQTISIAKAAAAVTIDRVEFPPGTTTDHLGVTHMPGSAEPAAPAGKKRGRPSKEEIAARAAKVGLPATATLAEVKAAEAGGQTSDPLSAEVKLAAALKERQEAGGPLPFETEKFPQMCACGVREDLPPHLHAKGCPVHHKTEPAPAHRSAPAAQTSEPTPPPPDRSASPTVTEAPPAPSLQDVRDAAIVFIGKHGKEKLGEILKTVAGAEKLTSVPPEKLGAVLAAVQE